MWCTHEIDPQFLQVSFTLYFFQCQNQKEKGKRRRFAIFSGFLLFFSAGGENFGRLWTSAGFCGKLARWNKFLLLYSTYQKCLNSRTNSLGAFLFVQKNWWSLTVLNYSINMTMAQRTPLESPNSITLDNEVSLTSWLLDTTREASKPLTVDHLRNY